MMVGQQIVLIVFLILSVLGNISTVGKPREPLTPGIAAWSTLINLIMIGLILSM
ncbi:hypothetical protein [Bifidobacterium breve]|uniref:hypothetical protein n=1 Tax=Bifidobacterium breve TaxID=1685 RepID=UPI0034A2737E